MKRRICALMACVSIVALPVIGAFASETVDYTYDARGRLVQVARTGSVNDGVSAAYSYDKADNRTNVAVTGAAPAGPSFAVADASGTEGGLVVFTVTRSGDISAAQSVSYATAGNTASSGADFTAASGTLSFAIGETSKTVSVTTLQDSTYEGPETFHLNLSGATGGATISDPQAVGTINDDDAPPAPSFAINDVSVTEGGSLVFTVTKTGSTSSGFSVNFASANGTASSGSDYTATSGTLTFAAADTTRTVTIATIDDTAVESAETVYVNLSGATGGATITDAQGVGTINDNDIATPSLSVSDADGLEGYTVTFVVSLSSSSSSTVTVNYATATGTAGTGDFTATSGTLTFSPGQTSKNVGVQTTNNLLVEDTEYFYLNLSSASGATISDAQGVGTIYDDDEGGGGGCPNCIIQSTPDESATEESPPGGGI